MREETITKYIADDGTEFNSKDECIRHEEKEHRNFAEMFRGMKYLYAKSEEVFPLGEADYGFLFVNIRNIDEAGRFAKWAWACSSAQVNLDVNIMVGETMVALCYDMDEDEHHIDSVLDVYTSSELITKAIKIYNQKVAKVLSM